MHWLQGIDEGRGNILMFSGLDMLCCTTWTGRDCNVRFCQCDDYVDGPCHRFASMPSMLPVLLLLSVAYRMVYQSV